MAMTGRACGQAALPFSAVSTSAVLSDLLLGKPCLTTTAMELSGSNPPRQEMKGHYIVLAISGIAVVWLDIFGRSQQYAINVVGDSSVQVNEAKLQFPAPPEVPLFKGSPFNHPPIRE